MLENPVSCRPFEIHVDPVMPEVTHFCLPGLRPVLKNATAFLHEAFEFYEEYLSCRYPYTYYKQVFVDQAYDILSPYASMTIFKWVLPLQYCNLLQVKRKGDDLLLYLIKKNSFFHSSTSLLHSSRVIDQGFETRKYLSQALAEQFFGCYLCIQTW